MAVSTNRYFGFNSTQENTLRLLLGTQEVGSVGTTELADGAITSAKIADATIVNADVAAAAAIAATKVAIAAGTAGLSAGTLQAELQSVRTLADNINTWAVALATKLNADVGVTDANYDTNPQT